MRRGRDGLGDGLDEVAITCLGQRAVRGPLVEQVAVDRDGPAAESAAQRSGPPERPGAGEHRQAAARPGDSDEVVDVGALGRRQRPVETLLRDEAVERHGALEARHAAVGLDERQEREKVRRHRRVPRSPGVEPRRLDAGERQVGQHLVEDLVVGEGVGGAADLLPQPRAPRPEARVQEQRRGLGPAGRRLGHRSRRNQGAEAGPGGVAGIVCLVRVAHNNTLVAIRLHTCLSTQSGTPGRESRIPQTAQQFGRLRGKLGSHL
ncbi:hypothetical protein RHAL1_01533 [Beijerinckiaceae bacterium RH AL1]|nr:hypothetical protein RHCH11_RHCH11_01496 [Beijerinckiaceae bacterium RH CH11]VVB45056.1 hypothetical protein RHAL8_01493 [Beijerinckiaceae bacterium RH AL8]VVC54634.1 hypothetical protein RHAL1_01533 [Beijerinckiaceae bacterium RH AL1]